MITKKEVMQIINNKLPPYEKEIHKAIAEALLDAWAGLDTIRELAKLRSDVNGFKAVAINHLPNDYTCKD